jgi:hypothetical protein
MARRHEHKPPKPKPKPKPKDKDKGKGNGGGGATTKEIQATASQGTPMPPGQDSYPVNPPDDQAAFSTGPGEAVQYDYTRQDMYAEQYAQEQLAAQQQQSTAGAGPVPGPGQAGVTTG